MLFCSLTNCKSNKRYYSTSVENQFKAIVPLNAITDDIYYIGEDNINMRMIISAPQIQIPNVFKVSKVETAPMFGLKRLTFSQSKYNKATDCYDEEELAEGDIFARYADYYDSEVLPDTPEHTESEKQMDSVHCDLICNATKIKVGGSYKLITAKFFNSSDDEITSNFSPYLAKSSWSCYIDDVDITDSNLITWLEQKDSNKIKIKFADNNEYLTKVLVVKCSVNKDGRNITGEVQLEISSIL